MTIREACRKLNIPDERRLRELLQHHFGRASRSDPRTRDGDMTFTGERMVLQIASKSPTEPRQTAAADGGGSSGDPASDVRGPVGDTPAFPRMDAEARRLWEAQEQNQARIIYLETENERLQEAAHKSYLVHEDHEARLAAVERRTPVRGTSSPIDIIQKGIAWYRQNFGGRGATAAVRGPVVFDGVSESMAGGRRH